MEFDTTTTAVAFVLVVAVATGALLAAPMMQPSTILTMVLPSMVVGGLVFFAIGVKYGEYRAGR